MAVLIAISLHAPRSFAASATVSGAEMPGYARAVLTFDELPKATARITNGVLIVSFDRAVTIGPDRLPMELPSYVSAVRVDPDRKGFRAALTRPLRANVMEAGERLYLDLLPESWKGSPPGLPTEVVEELSRRVRAAEEANRKLLRAGASETRRDLTFRSGTSMGMTRLVFDAGPSVDVRLERNGTEAQIVFAGPLRLEAERLKAAVAEQVKAIRAETSPGELRLFIELRPGVQATGFREDESYAVDFAPEAAKPAVSASQPAEARPAAQNNKPVAVAGPRADERGPTVPQKAVGRAEAAPSAATVSSTAGKQEAAIPDAPAPAPLRVADLRAPGQPRGSARLTMEDGKTARLALGTRVSAPLAVFEKDGLVWIAAEDEPSFDVPVLAEPASDLIASARASRVGRLAILQLALRRPALTRAAVVDGAWVVTIGDDVAGASQPILLNREDSPLAGSTIRALVGDSAPVHWVADPQSGDHLAIVPLRGAQKAVPAARSFVDARILPSAQGLVVLPLADDVTVSPGFSGIAIARAGGLALSRAGLETPSPKQASVLPPVIERERWRADRRGSVRDRDRQLLAEAADASGPAREAARLQLVRFRLANGLAAEAEGVLQALVIENTSISGDREFRHLSAIADILLGRPADAALLLPDDIPTRDPEATLWRAVAEASLGRWPAALTLFQHAAPAVPEMPEEVQALMLPLQAEAALRGGDFEQARRTTALLDGLPRHLVNGEAADYVRARLLAVQGKSEEAGALLAKLENGRDRPAQAKATVARAALELSSGKTPRTELLARLERNAVAWRGDPVELETILLLSRLYAEEERWRDVFGMARLATQLRPDADATRQLQDEAASQFEAVFLDGRGDSIPKLDALALYFDFREFTPPGRRGDEMIRRLAERLVDVDLLNEAAGLLQHQVDHRLGGAAKASVAARLGLIYLANREPARALQAIRSSRMAELPDELRQTRMLIEARALAELSRTDLALDLVGGESSAEANRLRADILWRAGRWREAGEQLELLVGERWKKKEPFDARTRVDVMRAAVAYGTAEDKLSLERLRGKMAAKMIDSEDARAFALVTAPSAAGLPEFRDLARLLSDADTLGEFVSEQRRKGLDGAPSPGPQTGTAPAKPGARG